LISFFILVPRYGDLGAAYSILISSAASAVFAITLFERAERRYIANSVIAVIIGSLTGYVINFMFEYSLLAIILSVIATSVVLLMLRNTSVSELRQLIRSLNRPSSVP
jgi:peptidoglycan biosynthesis protein MviN/MurJ (putative lipid II flippase)